MGSTAGSTQAPVRAQRSPSGSDAYPSRKQIRYAYEGSPGLTLQREGPEHTVFSITRLGLLKHLRKLTSTTLITLETPSLLPPGGLQSSLRALPVFNPPPTTDCSEGPLLKRLPQKTNYTLGFQDLVAWGKILSKNHGCWKPRVHMSDSISLRNLRTNHVFQVFRLRCPPPRDQWAPRRPRWRELLAKMCCPRWRAAWPSFSMACRDQAVDLFQVGRAWRTGWIGTSGLGDPMGADPSFFVPTTSQRLPCQSSVLPSFRVVLGPGFDLGDHMS